MGLLIMHSAQDIVGVVTMLTAFVLLPFSYGFYLWRKNLAAKHWPTTQGRIIESGLLPFRTRGGTQYKPKVIYEYTVGGTVYSSRQITLTNYVLGDKSGTEAFISPYPLGRTVTVHYNPKKPSDALLAFSTLHFPGFLMGAGIFFLGMIIIMMNE